MSVELTTQARYVIQAHFDLLRKEDQKTVDAAVKRAPEHKLTAPQPKPKSTSDLHARLHLTDNIRKDFIESMSCLFNISENELKEMALKRMV